MFLEKEDEFMGAVSKSDFTGYLTNQYFSSRRNISSPPPPSSPSHIRARNFILTLYTYRKISRLSRILAIPFAQRHQRDFLAKSKRWIKNLQSLQLDSRNIFQSVLTIVRYLPRISNNPYK